MELCSMICAALMGGKFGGEWVHVYIYVWLSPFTVHLKLPQHCKLAILQYKLFLVLKIIKNKITKKMHSFTVRVDSEQKL